ncbi:MAG: polysaccharide deacetylase [Acetatifactor sp.]|nr:polysaccharide deacetylase [Acetatifactor sp.]
MQEIAKQTSERRIRRVKMLKKLIVGVWIASVILPLLCCVFLVVRVSELGRTVERLNNRLEELDSLKYGWNRVDESEAYVDDADLSLPLTETEGRGYTQIKDASASADGSVKEIVDQSQNQEYAHQVYLTFDDGPSIYTDDILDILDQYDVKATFFVVGKEDETSKEALREIVERGHTLGMHSYSHKYSELYRSVDSFAEDFEKLQSYLFDVTGVKSTIYRFPGGSSNTVSNVSMLDLIDYLDQQGVTFYDWNNASGDGGTRLLSVQELQRNSLKDIEEWHTDIILLHDSADKRTTVEALPMIIESILAMDDTVILPITEDTTPVQHIHTNINK